jgi:(p)ppGpp synthase/HD superfamily hydrolase
LVRREGVAAECAGMTRSRRAKQEKREAGASRVDEAVELARAVHAGQLRKGRRTPYIEHVLAVASHVARAGGDEHERAAAMLHDAAEDGGGERLLPEIERRCGPRVAALVEELSDSLVDTTAGETKAPWRERKEAYVARLPQKTESGALIKAADQLANLEDCLEDYKQIGSALWLRFNTGDGQSRAERRSFVLWYHRSVLDGLRARGFERVAPLLDEVARVLDELEVISALDE